MLGVRRPPPPFSLDDLELERSAAASKVRKDHALSIYEATLQKLRLGSRRAFRKVEIPKKSPRNLTLTPPDADGSRCVA
ncbi:unnamed protein product [Spirodela intermedia]|uniref:Uncharacterized protein n=1 Tax=Spirodela intermedia TaxID=51605 RepID=A0A7I8JDT6_SPIIN|nr:unnamed protein product [Spirodela intermedia]CAA6668269.1 unnamed protein product [Spirodela intermedia]